MRLIGIPAAEIPVIWSAVADQVGIAADLSGGRHSVATVKEACRKAEMQLWCVMDPRRDRIVAVLVTEIRTYKTGLKVCDLVLMAGRQRDKWVHLVKDIETWAQTLDCAVCQATGREGWVRVMKEWGWDNTYVTIEKRLSAEEAEGESEAA